MLSPGSIMCSWPVHLVPLAEQPRPPSWALLGESRTAMPPIAVEQQELNRLYNLVDRSVVVLIRSKDGNSVDFGTGTVIYLDRKKVLISVDKSLIENDEVIDVRFYDNTRLTARLYMLKTLSRHAVLAVDRVAGLHPRAVTFSELEVTRQNLFTVAAVDKNGDLGLLTGTLGNPSCRAVDSFGKLHFGSENKFAMSCHVAGPRKIPDPNKEEILEPKEMTRLIGAAVFNMDGLVISFIDCADPFCYDLKFAIKASYFVNILEKYLKQIDQKINLSRGKKALNQGSIHHDTTSGSGSKKRGRMSTRDGMGTGKRVCMTQLDKVEVVSKEQVKGDKECVRREAIHRALMRLVMRESDAAWSSSSSSYDTHLATLPA